MFLQASRCVQELEVPHFHHELVYEVSQYLLTLPLTNIFFSLSFAGKKKHIHTDIQTITDRIIIVKLLLQHCFTLVIIVYSIYKS